jgi:type IV pilus assembly protein PilO
MPLTMDTILKISTPKKVIILVGILCALAALYYQSFFNPKQEELRVLKTEQTKLMNELSQSRAVEREYERFKEQERKQKEEMMKALTQIPNEKEIPEILKTITNLGKESNLEFNLFRPKPEQPGEDIVTVPIELTVLGSYHSTAIFFNKIGKLPRIINVVDFNMTRVKDVKGKGEADILIKTSCLINAFRSREMKSEEKKTEEKKSEKKKVPLEKEEGISKAPKE